MKVVLKPAARRDVRTILRYSRLEWGEAQRDEYRRAIDQALETLAAHPLIGQAQDEMRLGLRSFPVRQHVIFYRVGSHTVTVLRVLHSRMDAVRHLDEDS